MAGAAEAATQRGAGRGRRGAGARGSTPGCGATLTNRVPASVLLEAAFPAGWSTMVESKENIFRPSNSRPRRQSNRALCTVRPRTEPVCFPRQVSIASPLRLGRRWERGPNGQQALHQAPRLVQQGFREKPCRIRHQLAKFEPSSAECCRLSVTPTKAEVHFLPLQNLARPHPSPRRPTTSNSSHLFSGAGTPPAWLCLAQPWAVEGERGFEKASTSSRPGADPVLPGTGSTGNRHVPGSGARLPPYPRDGSHRVYPFFSPSPYRQGERWCSHTGTGRCPCRHFCPAGTQWGQEQALSSKRDEKAAHHLKPLTLGCC